MEIQALELVRILVNLLSLLVLNYQKAFSYVQACHVGLHQTGSWGGACPTECKSPGTSSGPGQVGFLNGEGGKVKMLEEEELQTGTQESLGENPRVGNLLGFPPRRGISHPGQVRHLKT